VGAAIGALARHAVDESVAKEIQALEAPEHGQTAPAASPGDDAWPPAAHEAQRPGADGAAN
jgi:hypothetical protein